MISHSLQVGFVTAGASQLALRRLGGTDKGFQRELAAMAGRAKRSKIPQTVEAQDATIRVWQTDSGFYFVRVDFAVGGAVGLWSWLARCCMECKMWETEVKMKARGGECVCSMKIAMAILGIELVPGGSNLSPILIDQAADGEFR
jgi:hypothetical protein